jgi:hypothetical protein
VTCYAVGNRGLLYATTDGASSWGSQMQTQTSYDLFGVACLSSTSCLAAGPPFLGSASVILGTSDSGAHWTNMLPIPATATPPPTATSAPLTSTATPTGLAGPTATLTPLATATRTATPLSIAATATPTVSSPAILNVPSFKQYYDAQTSPWGNDEYAHGFSESLECGRTLANCGCAVTSAAMVLAYFGVTKGPGGNEMNPRVLNEYFRRSKDGSPPTPDPSGYYTTIGYVGGDLNWEALARYTALAYPQHPNQRKLLAHREPYDAAVVSREVQAGRPVIIGVRSKFGQHFVVATGVLADTFIINDPANRDAALPTLKTYGYDPTNNVIVRFEEVHSDFSSLEIAAAAPSQALLTAPDGTQTGFRASDSAFLQGIPGSTYGFFPAIGDPTGNNPPPPTGAGTSWLIVAVPQHGRYDIQVTPGSGNRAVAAYAADQAGDSALAILAPSAGSGGTAAALTYSPTQGNPTVAVNYRGFLPMSVRNVRIG